MGETSKIEWTDASWTPIRARNRATGKVGWHCEHDTTGCKICYSERFNKAFGTGLPYKPGHRKDIDIFLDEKMLLAPLKWRKPRMIFVCSMTDLFADFVPDEWIDKVFAVMALCPQHTFQVLTKRAERMRDYVSHGGAFRISLEINRLTGSERLGAPWPIPNVWLGVSVERQQEADERIPHLMATPAAIWFVSAEPLLGPITLTYLEWARLDWVIVGGESGPGARPMHPSWPRDIRDQCSAAGVPFFFKQHGEWLSCADDDTAISYGSDPVHYWPGQDGDGACYRVGKKAAGRLLDGRTHDAMPSQPPPAPGQINPGHNDERSLPVGQTTEAGGALNTKESP